MNLRDHEGIQTLFKSILSPEKESLSDDALETRLKKISRKIILFKIIRVILGIGAALSFFFGTEKIGPLVGMLSIIPFFIAIIVFSVKIFIVKNEKKQLIGTNIVGGAVADEFEIIEYEALKFIDFNEIKAAALLGNWNSCEGSDFIRGKYKGVSFSSSDICLEQVNNHNGENSRHKVFKGQWLICELNKTLETPLRLCERSSEGKGKKSDVETENQAFNDKYKILTSDPHTVFYILTPHFMEYIVRMDNEARARTYMCFMGNKVHVALYNNRDLFEANDRKVLGGMNVAQLREQVKLEVKYITAVIDELLLNNYLFRKE